MERPEVIDPLKEEEQPIIQQTPVEEPEPIDTQTEDAFSVRGLAEKRLGKVGTGALDFVPIAGDILAAGDVVESYKKGDVLGTAINSAAFAVGLIPVVGDVAAKGLKAGLKATRAEKSDVPDIWSYPEQMYSSSGTSQNQIAAGYNELKRRGELKKGDKVVDIGGGRFDNLINDASEEGIDVKVFDPFNRTPEHNAAVADAVREGQADVAMSHNVLNVIKEDANIKTVIQQAENAVKPGGKAHFTVYEGNRSGVGGTTKAKTKTQTDQSFQRNQKTEDYVPFVEEIFGANNVTRKGKIITAVKRIVFDFKSPKGTVFKRGGKFGGLNFPVGKVIGGNQVYFHKNYIGSQPKEVQDLYNSALDKLPPDHNFNTLMYMKGKGDTPDTIRFDESADFDFAREPTPGKMVAIDANGNVANRSSNQIFHHKWMWVGDDYKGFDVNKEYNWSKQWTSKVDNFSGIGKKENWDRILEEKGLEVEGYREALPSGGAATIDFPFERKPYPSEKYTTQVSAPYDFEVEKALSDWNKGKLKPSQVKKVLERKGLDADLRGAGKYNSVDVFPARKFLKENELGKPETYEFFKGGAIKTYKEGGVVPMQEQMKFAFMNEGGVLADDGVKRDPVSGNEVPAGSMAEEVRDDVPAMLSEGEYVVPADVVRFHGIDKFEELRDEAKIGLARMEADGRIGGQPVEQQEEFPFPVEELEGFQEGGVVGDTYSSVTGSDFKANQPYGAVGGRFPGVGFELRNFTNPKTGRTVVIPFFNAQPMQYIPPDFLEGGATTTQGGTVDPTAGETDRQESEAQAARGMTPREADIQQRVKDALNKVDQRPTGKSFDQYTSEDWNNYIRNADSKTADVTAKLPAIGLLQRMSEKAARSFAKTALRSGKNPATEQPLSTEEKLTLERVLMVAPNTSMTESIINAITGRGETIQGLPLTEQAGFEFGKPVRQGDTMVKPVTKLPDDLLPDLSKFKQGEPTDTSKTKTADTTITEQDLPFFPAPAPDFVTQVGGTSAPTQQVDTQQDQLTSSKARKDSRGTKAQPFMSAAAQIASGNVKEGLFYNPGNIEIGQNYAGEIGTYADGRFAQFSAPQFGVRALAVDMKTKADRYNNNVESMLLEYLGGGRTGSRTSRYKKAEIENPNARTYISNAIKAVGSKKIDTSNVKQMKGLVEQIIRNENTKEIADFYLDQPNVIEEGIVLSQKSFPKETQLADARKALSGELFQAGLVRQPPATPVGLGQTAIAQQQAPTFDRPQTLGVPFTPPVQQPKPVADRPQTLGVPFTPPAIDTDDMLKQAAQNIPAGSDIGGTTPEYFGPPGFQNIIQPQTTTPKLDVDAPQSDLPFVQGPPVAPKVGAPAVSPSPVTMQDMQTQEAFGVAPRVSNLLPSPDKPSVVSEPGGLGQVAATSGTLPQVGATAPQPVAPFTPLGKPSDIAKLMPSPAEIEAQKAAEARKAREEQEKRIYEESQKKIAEQMKAAAAEQQAKVQAETKETAAANQARLEAKQKAKMDKRREKGVQAAVNIDTSGMSGAEVLNAQQDAIMVATTGFDSRGNLVDENVAFDRDEDSGGDSGGGGGATSGFGGGGGGGSSGGGCVIATHGLSTGGFTKLEKAKAEIWCEKKYHNKWYGEAFRRGYRAAGQRCIDRGRAKEHYQEFKDFVAYGRGVKKGFGLGLNYYLRTAQFFITGLFISE